MGPMGPMMGGWRGGSPAVDAWPSGGWGPGPLDVALVLLLVVVLAAVVFVVWRGSGAPRDERRPGSAEQILRERFARGELSREQYREALVDILKDRYVRGEVDMEGYEAQLGVLLGEAAPRPTDGRYAVTQASPGVPAAPRGSEARRGQ